MSPTLVGDVARGQATWVSVCATCHTTRDAYDVAHFGYPDSVILRRALKHVSQQDAYDVVAFVRSRGIPSVGRDARPFQPGTAVAPSDAEFWRQAFGTTGWPTGLTAAQIRATNPRLLDAPVALARWSSEADDTDWLPETPLAAELRNGRSGALGAAIDAYYSAPTTANLLDAIARFREVADIDGTAVCYGEAQTHPRARECFEARRWMSTLAAQHLMRPGADPVPVEVLDLWWSTGQAAVTTYFKEGGQPRSMVWGWLYLAYSFSPTRFREDNAYLGQFLQSDNRPYLAMYTALRRLVDSADVYQGVAAQRFWDAALAINRAPTGLQGDVAEFVFGFLDTWLATHGLAESERSAASRYVGFAYQIVAASAVDYAQLQRIIADRDRLLAALQ